MLLLPSKLTFQTRELSQRDSPDAVFKEQLESFMVPVSGEPQQLQLFCFIYPLSANISPCLCWARPNCLPAQGLSLPLDTFQTRRWGQTHNFPSLTPTVQLGGQRAG